MSESAERKFLHDIASPVGTAIFVLDMVLESMKERSDVSPEELVQVQKVYSALEKVKRAIEERRKILIQQGDAGSKPA